MKEKHVYKFMVILALFKNKRRKIMKQHKWDHKENQMYFENNYVFSRIM